MLIPRNTILTNPKNLEDRLIIIYNIDTRHRIYRDNFRILGNNNKRGWPKKVPAWAIQQMKLKAELEGKDYK